MVVWDWLFGGKRGSEARKAETLAIKASDPTSRGKEDIIKGATFCATLGLGTPLQYLVEHGRTYPRPTFDVEPEFGIWVPAVRSFRELGIDADEPPSGTVASQFGPVPAEGGALLPFLKDFRRIVESGASIDQQIEQLRALSDLRPEYGRSCAHFSTDLARAWFCLRLADLPGVGAKTAVALFDAGLRTQEEARAASDAQLLAISGVGRTLVATIRAS